jgi:hypothetical protein
MRNRREWIAALCLLFNTQQAVAQLLTTLFPEGVPGYGGEQGVTVQSRERPEFDPLGIRANTMIIRPLLTTSTGYDDNIFAGSSHLGAWEIATRPSFLITRDNPASTIAMYLSADDVRYLGESSQDRTDATAILGSTINFGHDILTLGAGYLARHEDRTALDALPSDRPVAFSVANSRASFTTTFGPFTATPSIDLNRWHFDNTTIQGVPVNEASRDRTTAQVGMTLKYTWMNAREVLLVTRVLDTHYDNPVPGTPTNNSASWQALLGVDYDGNTVWRFRMLGGVEYRQSESTAIASQTTGIAEAEITWQPSGMTTVRATAVRGIEDAAQTGLSNYTYDSARLSLDHEYLRNVLLNASATVREASFNQTGGQQFGFAFGAGATWLVNRNARISLTYDFTDVRNAHLPAGTVAGDYTRGLTLLTLRLGL